MNTQAQVLNLAGGEALQLPRRMAGPLVLTRGELLVQEPARWLAGNVVVPAPVRLVAPAVLAATPASSIVAVRASAVVLQQAAPLLSAAIRTIQCWSLSLRRRMRLHFAT